MQRAIFLSLLLLSIAVKSQVKISGKVTDNHNKILAGISISLQNSYDGATSDSLGNFSFITTEKGSHILSASSIGYKPFEQNINIDGNPLIVNISLKEAHLFSHFQNYEANSLCLRFHLCIVQHAYLGKCFLQYLNRNQLFVNHPLNQEILPQ